MSWLSGSVLLLWATLSVSSADNTENLMVHSRRTTLSVTRGSSVKLSCKASYNLRVCGQIHVVWREESDDPTKSLELTDPRKYFTTVSETETETIPGVDKRERQVVTEILNLRPVDGGRYHCYAECQNKDNAVGRVTEVIVKG